MAATPSSFSVLLGENDVGKTSFPQALDKYFVGKKVSDPADWFGRATENETRIVVRFSGCPAEELRDDRRADGSIVVSKVFPFDQTP